MIAIIAFLGYAVQYIQRIDISVAIVCMVNNTGLKLLNEQAAQTSVENFTQFSAEIDNGVNIQMKLSRVNTDEVVSSDTCYFKEQVGGKKMDGPFLWPKGNAKLKIKLFFFETFFFMSNFNYF